MQIRALSRAVEILNSVYADSEGITLSGIGKAVELSKATTYRFVQSLLAVEFLRVDLESGNYFLGPALLRLGRLTAPHDELRQIARPHMDVLRDRTGETVSLVVPMGVERMTIDVVLSGHELRAAPEVGNIKPLYAGAAGKAMFAFYPEENIARILSASQLKAIAPGTITAASALRRDLAKVRARGYAISIEETVLGQAASAAPVFGGGGEVITSLNISGPAARLPRPKLENHGELAAAAAAQISAKLGARKRNGGEAHSART